MPNVVSDEELNESLENPLANKDGKKGKPNSNATSRGLNPRLLF